MANSNESVRLAIFWILVPFFVAQAWFIGLRLYETQRALDDLYANAKVLVGKVSNNPKSDKNALIDEMVSNAGLSPKDTERARSFRALLQVINYMYVNSGETPQEFLSNITSRTRFRLSAQIFGIAFVQAVLVFFFPGMLIQSVLNAAREKRDVTTFEGFVRSERNKWLCRGESQAHFWRRALFAWLITTSTAYVFAPGGFAHAAEVGFVYLYDSTTAPSMLVWFEQFRQIPAVLCGMAGFLLYAVMTYISQSHDGTLSNATLSPLIQRGIVVAVIGLLLTSFHDDSHGLSILAFFVGVFPQAGATALATLAATGKPPAGPEGAFKDLRQIDYSKELALTEAGVTSLGELAKQNVVKLAKETGLNPRILLDSVDRAILLHAVNQETAEKLSEVPVLRATDFIEYYDLDKTNSERISQIRESTGLQAPNLLYERLTRDAKQILKIYSDFKNLEALIDPSSRQA
jgi:hypothetical protein